MPTGDEASLQPGTVEEEDPGNFCKVDSRLLDAIVDELMPTTFCFRLGLELGLRLGLKLGLY